MIISRMGNGFFTLGFSISASPTFQPHVACFSLQMWVLHHKLWRIHVEWRLAVLYFTAQWFIKKYRSHVRSCGGALTHMLKSQVWESNAEPTLEDNWADFRSDSASNDANLKLEWWSCSVRGLLEQKLPLQMRADWCHRPDVAVAATTLAWD